MREIAPDARAAFAGSDPCKQARAAHAVLLLLARDNDRAERDRAMDCGFAIVKDAGGVVVAPL